MIKVKFNTPQTFIANMEQGGWIYCDYAICSEVKENGLMTYIDIKDFYRVGVLSSSIKSIDQIKPTDL